MDVLIIVLASVENVTQELNPSIIICMNFFNEFKRRLCRVPFGFFTYPSSTFGAPAYEDEGVCLKILPPLRLRPSSTGDLVDLKESCNLLKNKYKVFVTIYLSFEGFLKDGKILEYINEFFSAHEKILPYDWYCFELRGFLEFH